MLELWRGAVADVAGEAIPLLACVLLVAWITRPRRPVRSIPEVEQRYPTVVVTRRPPFYDQDA